jgi:hypothetical protein
MEAVGWLLRGERSDVANAGTIFMQCIIDCLQEQWPHITTEGLVIVPPKECDTLVT